MLETVSLGALEGDGLVLTGIGLGGTSLMNANVFLRADEGALSMPQWPEEIRNVPGALDPCTEPPLPCFHGKTNTR